MKRESKDILKEPCAKEIIDGLNELIETYEKRLEIFRKKYSSFSDKVRAKETWLFLLSLKKTISKIYLPDPKKEIPETSTFKNMDHDGSVIVKGYKRKLWPGECVKGGFHEYEAMINIIPRQLCKKCGEECNPLTSFFSNG